MLNQLLEQFRSLMAGIDQFEALPAEQRTDEARAAYHESLTRAEAMRSEIETAQRAEQVRAFGNQGFHTPAPVFEGRAGTDLIRGDQQVDTEGWGISDSQARAIQEPSYRAAFRALLSGRPSAVQMRDLEAGLDAQGGYLVPPQMVDEIIRRDPQATGLINQVNVVQTSSNKLLMPRINYTTDDIYSSPVRIAWTGENGPAAAATDIPWGDIEIPVWTGGFTVEVSRDLRDDTPFALEQIVTQEAQNAFRLGVEEVMTTGDGVGKPRGLLTGVGAAGEIPTVNIGNPVTGDGLINLVYGLPPQYADGARALMNSVAMATYGQIKDSASAYVFGLDSRDSGLAVARQRTLLGAPIDVSPFMPVPGSANNVMAYGNWRRLYTLALRQGLSIEPLVEDKDMKSRNRVGWFFRFRMGGRVVQPRAARVGVQS